MKTSILTGILLAYSFVFASEKLHVTVHDQDGKPVRGADVLVIQPRYGISSYWSNGKPEVDEAKTDAEGKATVTFTARSPSVQWTVGAEGYYNERDKRTVTFDAKEDEKTFEPRLIEHEKTVEYVLWKKRNPQPMYGYWKLPYLTIPSKVGRWGFDLQCRDWVEPHGKGKVVDFYLVRSADENSEYREYTSWLEFEPGCGAYKRKKNVGSVFPSVYEADVNAVYEPKIKCVCRFVNDERVKLIDAVAEDEYLVMKTRAKKDETGKIVSVNYSKLYGRLVIGYDLIFEQYIFNPRPNDPNLELDLPRNMNERYRQNNILP